jgi:predicted AAA+ superfamily ATPase
MIAKKQKLAEELFHPKNFSEKQNKFLNDSYAKINLLSGAIQSGKTHIANLRFAKYVVLESEYDRFMINGNNLNSIYRNVIDNGFYR